MIHDMALHCIGLGWYVFPLNGKKPMTSAGFKDAVNTPELWEAMARRFPHMTGYGIATGPSGLVVLDVDVGEGKRGDESFLALESEHVVPDTLSVQSGGGGLHLYFTADKVRTVGSLTDLLGGESGLDIRSNGGYIVGPGSTHPSTGQPYTVVKNLGTAPVPDWLLGLIEDRKKPALAAGAMFAVAPDKPTDAELRAALARWKKASRKEHGAGVAWQAMRAVMRGDPYAAPGVIYDTTVHLTYWLSSDFPHLDQEWFIEQRVVPSWIKMWPNFEQPLIQADWARAWQTGLEKHQDEARAFGERKEARQASSVSDAFGGTRTEPYSDEEIAGFASESGVSTGHFVKRWIVQAANGYYIWFVGGYLGPFKQTELLTACAKYLAPAGSERVRLMTVSQSDGSFVRRGLEQVLGDYATHAAHVAYDLCADRTYYDGPHHTLVEATCPLRVDGLGGPAESAEVTAWLEGLCGTGEALERVLDWMSVATRLEQAAPAIWFLEGSGKGKSLFARGMGQLWSEHGRPCSLGDAMGRFNADILRCPMVEGDEGIPRDPRGRPMLDDLKRFISAENHRIEKKGMDLYETRGACRVVLSANNENMLALQADLTLDDIEALSQRVILVRVPEGAPKIDVDKAQRWLRDGTIARHALWLAETRTLGVMPQRFACATTPDELKNLIVSSSGLHGAVLEHITLEILSEGQVGAGGLMSTRTEPAVRVDTQKGILVCGTLLKGELGKHGAFTKAFMSTKAMNDGLKAVVMHGRQVRPQVVYAGNTRMRYWQLCPEKFSAWLQDSDFSLQDVISAIEKKQASQEVAGVDKSGLN